MLTYFCLNCREHELSHINGLPTYKCAFCQAEVLNAHELQDHAKQAHSTEYIMYCSLCEAGFLHEDQYDLHYQRKSEYISRK